jgi:hypothetical protein
MPPSNGVDELGQHHSMSFVPPRSSRCWQGRSRWQSRCLPSISAQARATAQVLTAQVLTAQVLTAQVLTAQVLGAPTPDIVARPWAATKEAWFHEVILFELDQLSRPHLLGFLALKRVDADWREYRHDGSIGIDFECYCACRRHQGCHCLETGTSVRPRFLGRCRTSRCLPVSADVGVSAVKHNGWSRIKR